MRKCEACGREGLTVVASSTCGPISHAYCKECICDGTEPYGSLIAYISGALSYNQVDNFRDYLRPGFIPTIIKTLEKNGKSEEGFIKDLKVCIKDFDDMMKEMEIEFREEEE